MIEMWAWLDIGFDKDGGVERLSKFLIGFLNLLNGKVINSKWGNL